MEKTNPQVEIGSAYAKLLRRVTEAGLHRRCPGYYAAKIAITELLFAAGWVAFFMVGASWYNLVTAAYLAVMSTQVAFIGHDAGHKQIFRKNKANDRLSLVLGNLMLGMSTGWWIDKHNRHHANPNHIGKDPDVGVGALVHTKRQAEARGPVGRFFSRNQAWLFFPMLLLEGIALHVQSIRTMLGGTVKSKRMRIVESFLLLMHILLYLTAVFTVLTPVQAIAFIALNQGLWGLYMGISFAPNHKGMPILEDGNTLDYLRRQVLTSRNIRGGRLLTLALGGLNYQIEHHLFPSMPRPGLVRSQKIVRDYCRENDVLYTETSVWESYAQALRHLRDVGVDA